MVHTSVQMIPESAVLSCAISILQTLTSAEPDLDIGILTDFDKDTVIGIEDAVYYLQIASGMR